MLEAFVNTPLQTILVGPNNVSAPNATLYLGSDPAGISITTTQQGSSPVWTLSFTPTQTGSYTLVAFGVVQFRVTAVVRSLYSYLINIEDEAVGSWEWDKTAGTLTMLRQDGSTLQVFDVVDTLETSSRERTT